MSEQRKLLIVVSFPLAMTEEAIHKLSRSIESQVDKSVYDLMFVPEGVSVTNPPDFAELTKAIGQMSFAVKSMCHEVAQSVAFGSQCLEVLLNDDVDGEEEETHYLNGSPLSS